MTLEATLDPTVDDDVEFVFHVVNTGTDPIELTFRSGLTADLTVYDADGETVWQWSEGRMFTQAVERATLDPGEAFEQQFRWNEPPDGTYTAVATLEAETTVEAQTTVSV